MQARMKNPAIVIPEAMEPIKALLAATHKGGVAPKTLALVHLRASQINGCSFCVDSGSQHAQQFGESTQRLPAVSAWRDTPYFTDAERAALALTEAVTRLSDRAAPCRMRCGTRRPGTMTNVASPRCYWRLRSRMCSTG